MKLGKINFNNDIDYETNEEKKFKITRGMVIIGVAILLVVLILVIIIINFINSNKKETYTQRDFLSLESRMEEEAPLYILQKQVVLTENDYKIDLNDLLTDTGGTINSSKNPVVNICKGYVLAKKIDSESYDAFISCGKYYTTTGFVSNDKENITTTTKKAKDTEKPNLLLIGEKNITINMGQSYNEPGFSATDNIDGDVTAKVKVVGSVDTTKPGEYKLSYSVSDSSGNLAEEKRVIKVIETTTKAPTTSNNLTTTTRVTTTTRRVVTTTKTTTVPKIAPTITLYGSKVITLYVGDSYKDPGYSAIDCMGANITSKVDVSGSVNTKVATTYYINYSVTDKYGNKAVATRTVIVKTKNIPVTGISLSPNTVELQKGQTKKISVYITPSNATDKTITWTSSNNSIATISSGVITGRSKGSAIITATTSNGKSYAVRVEVK